MGFPKGYPMGTGEEAFLVSRVRVKVRSRVRVRVEFRFRIRVKIRISAEVSR
jgi:hypothetical protein